MDTSDLSESIAIHIPNHGYVMFNRDRLTTAYLIFLDLPANLEPEDKLDVMMNRLLDLDWDIADVIMYSQAVIVCIIQGVEP